MAEYQETGHFNHQEKVKYAVRTMVYWNLGYLVVGIIFVIYLMIRQGIGFKDLPLTIISIANL